MDYQNPLRIGREYGPTPAGISVKKGESGTAIRGNYWHVNGQVEYRRGVASQCINSPICPY